MRKDYENGKFSTVKTLSKKSPLKDQTMPEV
jgi:hypothetical protein